MEIRFCTVCNESIPDGEFDAGRAVATGKRSQHVACALRRSVEMSGIRSFLTFGLALLAAGISVFLLIAHLGADKGPPKILETPAVVSNDIAAAIRATERRLANRETEVHAALQERLEGDFKKSLTDVLNTSVRASLDKQDERLRETAKQIHDRLIGVDKFTRKLQDQIDQFIAWKIEIEKEAERLKSLEERKPSEPTPAVEEPAPDGGAPEPDLEREKEIDRWLKRLRDADEDIVFSATIELARLKALRATPELVIVLTKHKDFYARLGAATALGEIRSCDGVLDLIESLNDKDDLVRTAASEALHRITEQDFNFVSGLPKSDRVKIQKKWRNWWRDNETAVRTRLGQPSTK
jgi:hypothetical protein